MRTQKPLESVGWLGGANNRLVVHEGAKAMNESNEDLLREDECIRSNCIETAGHYGPHTNDLDRDVDADQMTHSDEPTTKEEREGWLRDDEVYNDPTAVHDIILRLITEVEAGERHLQSLKDDSGDIICDLEDQVKRLDAERGCPSCAHCQLKRGGHLA